MGGSRGVLRSRSSGGKGPPLRCIPECGCPATLPDRALSDPEFVHLHTHTEYSLLDGASRIDEAVKAAKAAGQEALAITDHGSLYGVIPFYKACRAAGVKPIIGCETYVAQRSLHDKESRVDRDPHHLVLLAANETGYRNLMHMISVAHLEGFYVRPRVDKELLGRHSEGVIALSACLAGEVAQRVLASDLDGAAKAAEEYREMFGDRYFLEIQNHGMGEEDMVRKGVIEVARRTGIPLVATNDSHYTARGDAPTHDVLLCIQTGKRVADQDRMRFSGDGFYMRTAGEMLKLFPEVEEAVRNTAEVARRCDVGIELGHTLLPRYDVPEGLTPDQYLRAVSEDGFRRRYPDPTPEHHSRLEHELEVITEMGYAAYFLIVWDFVRHAKESGVLVGPGRGSAAGSIVSYCLDITSLDPLQYGLIFERFLNRDRVSMPDIDIDFSVEGRESVIRYVSEKYGADRVAQIGTFGTMAGKAAIRDVGRVLDVPIPEVDPIAKMVPVFQGKTKPLEVALREVPELKAAYNSDPRYKELIDTAMRLEGITRSVGTHAAGVVIAPEPLEHFVPLQRGTTDKSTIVTQYEMNAIQELGLLKMDFLGLRNLDIIDACIRLVEKTRGVKVDIETLPLDDPPTYELLQKGDTLGLFQLESPGMRRVLLQLKPTGFEDISAVNALYRPGPMEQIPTFVACKHGFQEAKAPHPLLEEVLRDTYGVAVYQEQVMQMAQVLAGFTLGEADILRAAMGKKDKAKMAKQREKFIKGCVDVNAIPEAKAAEIFDLINVFAGYAFNRCVSGETVVFDAVTGERTTVRSLHERPREFTVHGLGSDGRLRPRSVTGVHANGRKPLFRLRTAQGREVRATDTHRFRAVGGWKRLGELRAGDRIALPRRYDVYSTKRWPEHELVVLAGLLAEGNTCHPSCLYYYNNERVLVDDFAAAAERFPATVARVDYRQGNRLQVCLSTGRDMRFQSRSQRASSTAVALEVEEAHAPRRSGAFTWAQELGIVGVKATAKGVPDAVFELCDADIELFLGRMWAGDGYIGAAGQDRPFYATSSRQLAVDVQDLLLRLGILSGLHTKAFKYRGQLKPGYTVQLLGDEAVRRFVDRVGPHCVGREDEVDALAAIAWAETRDINYVDTVPADAVRAMVDAERSKAGLTWQELEARSGISTRELRPGGSPGKKGFRRTTLLRLALFFGSQELADLGASDVLWDRVVSIEPDGEDETFDLTVDTDHSFIADGIVVHNSHASAYGLISYWTSYLKANYTIEYLCALMRNEDDQDRMAAIIVDCQDHGIEVTPPDVNASEADFTVVAMPEGPTNGVLKPPDGGRIAFGLRGVKNVGVQAIDLIVQERRAHGPYESLLDLCLRLDLHQVNKRVLEALIKCGALDSLGERAQLLASLDRVADRAQQVQRERASGQVSLFGDADGGDVEVRLVAGVAPADDRTRLAWEREFLGIYLSDHPLKRVEMEMHARTDTRCIEVTPELAGYEVRLGGVVREVRRRPDRSGRSMAFVELEDLTGSVPVTVFSRVLEQCTELLVPDRIVIMRGKVDTGRRSRDSGDGETASIIADAIWAFEAPDPNPFARAQVVHITVPAGGAGGALAGVGELIDQFPGEDPVVVHVEEPDRVTDIEVLGRKVAHGPELQAAVDALLGIGNYRCEVIRRKVPERRGGPPRETRTPAAEFAMVGVDIEVEAG